jgi:succinoglycan biosynthesis protein ExoA
MVYQLYLNKVCIAIPALNEELYIENVIRSFIDSDQGLIGEIVVADGGSQDATRSIVSRIAQMDERVKLIDNPGIIKAPAMNLILHQTSMPIFLVADAHCHYAKDYVLSCVRALYDSGALVVGGCQRYAALNSFQLGVGVAARSFLGSGGSRYRDPNYTGPADTVFLGCYLSSALRSIGGFSSDFPINEDAELNYRISQAFSHQGGVFFKENTTFISDKVTTHPVCLYSTIRVWYYPRRNIASLSRQYFRYGRGRWQTLMKHGNIPFRSITPAICIFLFATFPALEYFLFGYLYATLTIIMILFICFLIQSIKTEALLRKNGELSEMWHDYKKPQGSRIFLWFITLSVLISMSTMQGSGMIFQFFRRTIFNIKQW